MNMYGPLFFALTAAIGNAMFATGQKKATAFDNPFTFIALAAIVCVCLTVAVALLYGQPQYSAVTKENGWWAVLSGTGLFLTYIGFNLLYSKYGASNYILYAVLSIITTSIIVGVFMFKETFNLYHWLAFGSSIVAVVLFSIGNASIKT
ncbi:MAG: drug/metabolite transporter (DMT)-like permease [Gammaproteobacteria bacterium]|jgi:drug/metabolite transporter (DMT)-like permease